MDAVKKAVLVFLLLGCVVGTVSVLSGKELRCSVCGKVITGEYYSSGGKVFCSKECWLKTRPRCAVCGRRILKGGFIYHGKIVCSRECLDALLPKCAICGKPVRGGTGIKSGGKYYCSEECFKKSLPRCCICGKPLTRLFRVHGKIYCEECYNTPKCLQCGCPTGGEKLPDGRPFCAACKKKGITDPERAFAIFREVRRLMETRFGVKTHPAIEFYFVDLPRLLEVSGKDDVREDGLYRCFTVETREDVVVFGVTIKKDVRTTRRTRRQIYVLTWLDEPHLRQVCAHELMHDWTHEHFPDIKDDEVIEGLSEYMAYLCNRCYGYTALNALKMKNADPVYGGGFRLVLQADKGGGIADIRKWLSSGAYRLDLERMRRQGGRPAGAARKNHDTGGKLSPVPPAADGPRIRKSPPR